MVAGGYFREEIQKKQIDTLKYSTQIKKPLQIESILPHLPTGIVK